MERGERRRKSIDTEASGGAEKSSVNSVVVRKNVSAIDAAGLNGMICLCVKHRIHAVTASVCSAHPGHFALSLLLFFFFFFY